MTTDKLVLVNKAEDHNFVDGLNSYNNNAITHSFDIHFYAFAVNVLRSLNTKKLHSHKFSLLPFSMLHLNGTRRLKGLF